MKKILSLFLTLALLLSIPITNVSAAQANPTITSPTASSSLSRADVAVKWSAVTGATYKISMRDLTVNMLVLSNETASTNSYTILKKYLYEGHEYRIAVSATIGSTVTWSESTFKITLSSARQTILNRASTMNSYSWKPAKDMQGWNYAKYFKTGTTYSGIPYTQNVQCSITSVNWVGGVYFDTKLSEAVQNPTTTNFYDVITIGSNNMSRNGSDCSGYVSVAYNIARENTTGLASSRTLISYSGDTTDLQKYARLSPGDILNASGDHVVIVKSITPVNNSSGVVQSLDIVTLEQTPYYCQSKTRSTTYFSSSKYKPMTKDSSLAQDYSWAWK